MSIPILVMLNMTLNRYGSNWPGKRGFEDDFDNEKKVKEEGKVGKFKRNNVNGSTVAEILRNSTCESAFAEEIKKGIMRGTATDTNTPSDISQIAYAGMSHDLSYCIVRVHHFDIILHTNRYRN